MTMYSHIPGSNINVLYCKIYEKYKYKLGLYTFCYLTTLSVLRLHRVHNRISNGSEAVGGMSTGWGHRSNRRKHAPVPQIPHERTWDRSRRLTACAMSRPNWLLSGDRTDVGHTLWRCMNITTVTYSFFLLIIVIIRNNRKTPWVWVFELTKINFQNTEPIRSQPNKWHWNVLEV
jgi:hypothetical protein